jgi:tRNA-dihydrouridine synthase A
MINIHNKYSIAPMMDWTDKYCRYFHRVLAKDVLVYTEMVVADAIFHGNQSKLLDFNKLEHPIAVQLGGSDIEKLVYATKRCEDFGYDEINLNVGCPSDRVQSGQFGACLMKTPNLVADIVHAMQKNVKIPVSVKCRIGVDNQNPEEILPHFITLMEQAGIKKIIIHARKAWLNGLSPKDNRTIPPLDYNLVYEIKKQFSHLNIHINGGIDTIESMQEHLKFVDGVMIGRAAYHNPSIIIEMNEEKKLDKSIIYQKSYKAIHQMIEAYNTLWIQHNIPVHHISRHFLGLFHGFQGAKLWRRHISEQTHKRPYDANILSEALAFIHYSAATDIE